MEDVQFATQRLQAVQFVARLAGQDESLLRHRKVQIPCDRPNPLAGTGLYPYSYNFATTPFAERTRPKSIRGRDRDSNHCPPIKDFHLRAISGLCRTNFYRLTFSSLQASSPGSIPPAYEAVPGSLASIPRDKYGGRHPHKSVRFPSGGVGAPSDLAISDNWRSPIAVGQMPSETLKPPTWHRLETHERPGEPRVAMEQGTN